MKKIIICTFILSMISISTFGYMAFKYYSYQSSYYEKSMDIQNDMKKIDEDMNKMKDLSQETKIKNEEKIGILELWKKRLEKIKK